MSELSWRLLTAACAVVVLGAAALWIRTPGYTDAEYYLATAIELAEGRGFSEPFLWNFLAGVEEIPHASHLYWMPLTSMVAALPMALFRAEFRVAQGLFVLLWAAVPWLTAEIARELQASERQTRLAAWFAVFPGFFLPFLATTDAFALYALLGGACLLLLARLARGGSPRLALLAGLAAGAAHLTRADGLLWLAPAALATYVRKSDRLRVGLYVLAGYVLIMGPWAARLQAVSGSPLPPGGSAAAWLRSYDELFSYPAERLDPSHLWTAGLPAIAGSRLQAAGQNLLSFVGVNGLVYLTPFLLWAGWRQRRRPLVWLGGVYAGALFMAMSLVFPFPGARGGFFHSSAGLMPLLWPLAVLGIDEAVARASSIRGWRVGRAQRAFGYGAVMIAAIATAFLFWERVIRPADKGAGWNSSAATYEQVGRSLHQLDAEPGLVAVNNPPGFWLATKLPSVVIPNGSEEELEAVASDFGVEWIVLERNHPAGLGAAYANPTSLSAFRLVKSLSPHQGSEVHLLQPVWMLE